jgi:hypothetical protein
MKRAISAVLLVSSFASTAAFADCCNGIGYAEQHRYLSLNAEGRKSRAEAQREAAAARADGTLPSTNKQADPALGLEGQTHVGDARASQ